MNKYANIINLAKELNCLYEEMYQQLNLSVDYIIKNKITSTNTIEHCLDLVLGIPTEKGEQLFYKLCKYYLTVNEQNAKEYFDIYEENYGLKEEISHKKTK